MVLNSIPSKIWWWVGESKMDTTHTYTSGQIKQHRNSFVVEAKDFEPVQLV